MWCPQCAAEYRPGFARCPDCELDLVAERPRAPAPPPAVVADHDLVEYDLLELTDEQTRLLALLLDGAEIPFTWEPTRRLVVARAVADDVDEVLDFVDASAGDLPSSVDDSGPRHAPAAVAGSWRRLGGAVIDGLVLNVPSWAIGSMLHTGFTALVAWTVVQLAYAIAPVARWGRTPGKLAMGTRVVMVDGTSPPGFRAAVIRGVVPFLGIFAFGVVYFAIRPLSPVFVVLAALWPFAVFGPVLLPDHRGLHDVAAGTVVVRDGR